MDTTLLIVDDDKVMHVMAKAILGEEYALLHAYDTQQAIDMISGEKINLILSDIHMPGMDGLEFLESLMADSEKKNIPVLIMTAQPTVDKEKEALNLGAADFIDKQLFNTEKEAIKDRISSKLATTIDIPELNQKLIRAKKEFTKRLMEDAMGGDFFTLARTLCMNAGKYFSADVAFFWTIHSGEPRLILGTGNSKMHQLGPDKLLPEETYKKMVKVKKPYFSNHVFGEGEGIFKEISKTENLPVEIGIPLFKVTDKEFIKFKRRIPPKAGLFAYVVLKRKKLLNTTEYNLISRLFTQSGTVLWRLYREF